METVWHLPLPEEGCGHFPFLQWWNCTSVEVLRFGEGRSPYLVSPSLWCMVVGPSSMHLLVTSPLQCAASPERHVLSMRCLPVGPLLQLRCPGVVTVVPAQPAFSVARAEGSRSWHFPGFGIEMGKGTSKNSHSPIHLTPGLFLSGPGSEINSSSVSFSRLA